MKTRSFLALVSLSVAFSARPQTQSILSVTSQRPLDTPDTIVSKDQDSRVHQRTTYVQDPSSGQWVPQVHSFTELSSGACYQQNGQWFDSVEQIDPAPTGGAQALQAPHHVYFPYDIYDGVLQVVTPDGITLQSRPLGISFFDGTNSVLLAELTNSIGAIISPNQLIYTNAFTDFPADLLITFRKSGLECDVVLRSQIPDPRSYGLSPASTRLELLTEFFNTADPAQTQPSTLEGVNNFTLGFGSQMKMVRGKAFQIGSSSPGDPRIGIPVGKTWTHINGRTFLIEEVSYPLISQQLNTLPSLASAPRVAQPARRVVASREDGSRLRVLAASRRPDLALPPARSPRPSTNIIRVAQSDPARKPGMCASNQFMRAK